MDPMYPMAHPISSMGKIWKIWAALIEKAIAALIP
jgi:hypothetical protein